MRIAILDLGTNTFNLLIAEHNNTSDINYLHSSKEAVKLGEGGIIDNVLQPAAIDRGREAIRRHYRKIEEFKARKVYAFATSAIRDAKNRDIFLQGVKEEFDLFINVIPGNREAELIYKGVREACNLANEKALIVDIGGGSNECIIADGKKILWKKSYNLGMARILEKFKPEDPLEEATTRQIENYLEAELSELLEMLEKRNPTLLIGASGSFETFHALVKNLLPEKYPAEVAASTEIHLEDYRGLHEKLLRSTIAERKKMPGMEPVRVEMIVLASIFVNFILRKWVCKKMLLSRYALKEGVITEMLKN